MIKKIFHIVLVFALTGRAFTSSAQMVTLDYYFNHETHKSKSGQEVRFHYMWEDTWNSGFSILGEVFKSQGAKLQSLESAPTTANLKGTNIYIIVDPDTRKETAHPNYIEEKDIKEIERWVKAGGVLVMLANDSANVELPHFNNLAAKFGMHFNDDLQNHVVDDRHFQDGAIVTTNNPIFKTAKKIFMKDVCSIDIKERAYAGLRNSNNAVIIAIAKYGKGTVVAAGDPWLYNEYTNGRLPAEYENNKAAEDIARWLIKQIPE
ncbi:MAG: unsaturated rhamnogalacturonyl hydrolase [Mucilaginibacter sp.]|nr:unsaturated rhamnogalacturonyl hydrolase [Mucilaginibacter sp.]